MKIKLLLIISCFCFALTANSQKRKCAPINDMSVYLSNPENLKAHQANEAFIKKWVNDKKNNRIKKEVITIPVVVHVVYRTEAQNISDAQIKSQIAVLNEDFRKLNSDISVAPAAFSEVSADIEINFALANRDPDGNTTTGITRRMTTTVDIGKALTGADSNVKNTNTGGTDSWDVSKYLNIWIAEAGKEGGSDILGYASPPQASSTLQALADQDGVVIISTAFGNTGTVQSPFNLGRTATHEVGHYLNLIHIWGDGDCNVDDEVVDTPPQGASTSGCPVFPVTSGGTHCAAAPNGPMFVNYMDYSNDACLVMFTQGQKTRMLAALAGPRIGLKTSNGLSVKDFSADFNLSIYPNPSKDNINLTYNNLLARNGGDVLIYDITGKEVLQEKINKNQFSKSINVSKLTNGIYFLKINSDNKNLVKKIIIE
ncbi:T9SS type A sorting domain-containing protein [Lutibacter sp. Hel_I_33_5]|uniref:T9SS type A sorting domain-containing protein n=1 Tax=Lutibacter sp. Hel_I_33_5 TaxID=1566289 RepID=UPI001646A898|nr:T9SS type A sorting domain-containing protein [Lutibacter sp. Hel_I_33_5]